jgi:homopolymeric O-antigen transport system permease protein
VSVSERTPPITVIRPSRGWGGLDLGELWHFRELLYFLTWRDVLVRYKQTLLGAAWAILKPFLSMVIFSIIFGRLAGIPTDGVPGPVFYFTGLLPWTLFQDGISKAGASLVTGRTLVTKVYFPRLLVPLSAVLGGLVDFLLSAVVLVGMMFFYHVSPTASLWTLPLFLGLTLMTSLGVGLWLAALNVAYRDVGYVIPFIVQAWMYASPVAYSATLIPQGLGQLAYALNPMAGAIQGFRWAVLSVGEPSMLMLGLSSLVALLSLVSGIVYFRRMERTFADIV